MKILCVIDVQNDFISGSLGSPQAQAVAPKIVEKVKEYKEKGYIIIVTKDVHIDNKKDMIEYQILPEHCNTVEGCKLYPPLSSLINTFFDSDKNVVYKNTFAVKKWKKEINKARANAILTKDIENPDVNIPATDT